MVSRCVTVLIIFLTLFSLGPGICSASLQQAVDESVDGCIILMRAGTWNENVEIDNDLTIIGGVGGGQTTIDGNGADSVFKIDYADVVLTGLAITNGNGEYGGGIWNNHGMLTLNDVSISDNMAVWGGGVFNEYGTVTMNDVAITGNWAIYGGGVDNYGGAVTMNGRSSITGNTGVIGGGGVYNMWSSSTFEMNGASSISGNTATSGVGGGIYNYLGTCTMTGASSISYNTADDGGGVYNHGHAGGGIFSMYGASSISHNTATGEVLTGRGGGIFNDGGGTVMLNDASSITYNTADTGGGIYNDGGTYGPADISSRVHDNDPDDIVG
jgi:hypothetical protein